MPRRGKTAQRCAAVARRARPSFFEQSEKKRRAEQTCERRSIAAAQLGLWPSWPRAPKKENYAFYIKAAAFNHLFNLLTYV